VVFSGHYPAGPHRFVSAFVRTYTKALAFGFGLTDKYPNFGQ